MPTLIQPYADRHVHLNGPGDQRPTATEVIRDQGLVDRLVGVNILITGCTSGIGIETARALYLTGANVWITARDLTRGNAVAAELSTESTRSVKVLEMDLGSFESIRSAAGTFLSQTSKLNILINNAGIMMCPHGVTKEGHELQFGTNHLGHFLLFQLLEPALLAAAAPKLPSRVISVSSLGHRLVPGPLDLDDLGFTRTEYNPMIAYARSKLANVYFANHLDRIHGPRHLHAVSLHPGSIPTNLAQHMQGSEWYDQVQANTGYQKQRKSVEQGAATTVWAAVGTEWNDKGGRYLENVGEAGPAAAEGLSWSPGHSKLAYRPEDERKLWEASVKLTETSLQPATPRWRH